MQKCGSQTFHFVYILHSSDTLKNLINGTIRIDVLLIWFLEVQAYTKSIQHPLVQKAGVV